MSATKQLWPAQVFYDGQCPVCSREAALYARRDREQHLEFIDIAAPGFEAARYGLDPQRVNTVMHARTADGVVHTEVDAFRVIWWALPAGVMTRVPLLLLKVPGAMPAAGLFYRWFARNRRRLTGRCDGRACAVNAAGKRDKNHEP